MERQAITVCDVTAVECHQDKLRVGSLARPSQKPKHVSQGGICVDKRREGQGLERRVKVRQKEQHKEMT